MSWWCRWVGPTPNPLPKGKGLKALTSALSQGERGVDCGFRRNDGWVLMAGGW